jgi:hypothetical protein
MSLVVGTTHEEVDGGLSLDSARRLRLLVRRGAGTSRVLMRSGDGLAGCRAFAACSAPVSRSCHWAATYWLSNGHAELDE